MHFVHRVRTVWSWLPAFRAVAETEHLPTAAHELGVVPSSLSRTIKLLEDELGVALFDRTGKALVLNDAGRTLLASVRDAMRLVDESLVSAMSDELRGDIGAVACADLVRTLLVPACAVLANQHPALCVLTSVAPEDGVANVLLRGDADVALVLTPPDHPELRSFELASWSRAVYARVPLADGPLACVVVGSPRFHHDDGWPTGHERTIAAWAADEHAALALCTRTRLATVAFDVVARDAGHPELRRIPAPAIPPRAIFAVHRRAIGTHRRTDALLRAIRDVAGSVTAAAR